MIDAIKGDMTALFTQARDLAAPYEITPGAPEGTHTRPHFVVMPSGMELHSLKRYLDEFRHRPERVTETVTMADVESLIAYIDRFKTTTTAVFINPDSFNPNAKPSAVAIIDHHDQSDGVTGPAIANWRRHKARYDFPLSAEMRRWIAASQKKLTQVDFAELLEERSVDIVNPPADWMMIGDDRLSLLLDLLNLADDIGSTNDGDLTPDPDSDPDDTQDYVIPRTAIYKLRRLRIAGQAAMERMARGVEVSVTGKAVATFNPKTGARQVSFYEDAAAHDAIGRPILMPDYFLLNIPVFENGPRQTLPCRLTIRSRGSVEWGVTLVDWRRLVTLAVHSVGDLIATRTGRPVFYGEEPK